MKVATDRRREFRGHANDSETSSTRGRVAPSFLVKTFFSPANFFSVRR